MHIVKSLALSAFIIMAIFPKDSFSESSKSIMGKINDSRARKEISRDEAAMYKTFFLFDRERLPAEFYTEDIVIPVKNATLIIRDLKREFESLLPQTKETLRHYLFKSKRPEYFQQIGVSNKSTASKYAIIGGFELANYTVTSNFKIQWGNAIEIEPSYVAKWAEYLETSWSEIITEQGYDDPLPNNQVDVYIGATDTTDIYDSEVPIYPYLYGYVSYYSDIHVPYMVVNHDYSWALPNEDLEGWEIGAMKVTAAHEYFHVVHLAMDYEEDAWWIEATATWMEDEVYDDVNDYFNFINRNYGWTKHPNASLLLFNGSHEYGSAIWGKYVSESWGGAQAIKQIWNNCKTPQGPNSEDALNSFFANYSSSLKEEFKKFASGNAFMNYSEGENYGKMFTRTSHWNFPVMQISSNLVGQSPDYLGSNYIHFQSASGNDLTISFDGDEYFNSREIEWGANIALSTYTSYSTIEIPLDPDRQSGSVTITDYAKYTDIYLVTTVLSASGITPSEDSYTWYYYYPDGIPYSYHACEDCSPPALPLTEFTDNDNGVNSGIGGVGEYGYFGGNSGSSNSTGNRGSGGSCFIATAAYGYYDEPHVMLLREFRDKILLTNPAGRSFVDLYYNVSPPMADFISQREWLKSIVRIMLMPLIGFAWLTLKMPVTLILSLFIVLLTVGVKLYSLKKSFKKQLIGNN